MKKNLSQKRYNKVPRLLMGDAYTIGSHGFESEEAGKESVYYITFRKPLYSSNPDLYSPTDHRLVFNGLDRICEELFYEPITHQEIDLAKEYLKNAKATMNGLEKFDFPELMWRTIVDQYDGYPPIKIEGMPTCSVVYPNEPVAQIRNQIKDENIQFGVLAAWFESKLLQCWATTERVTQNENMYKYFLSLEERIYGNTTTKEHKEFMASLMIHDFGDRSGICSMESEVLGMVHLYTFGGTDTFSGAYQAFRLGNEPQGSSVNALAHRNVQSYKHESDCYRALFDYSNAYEFNSMVADLNNFFKAVKGYLLPLAIESSEKKLNKIVVARPDSGDALEQILFIINLAVENGLYTEKIINGKKWKFATTLKFIEGDGMTFKDMKNICEKLMELGFAPSGWGLFGVGGGLRNALKRDNTSAKYALTSVNGRSVVKFSETFGKMTLPGPFKVLRTQEALNNKKTIVFEHEEGESVFVNYYDGLATNPFYGTEYTETFNERKSRLRKQMEIMPENLQTEHNHNTPASDAIIEERIRLVKLYAPEKYDKLVY
jgi:nicotinic acid phosphoribosyltransferase